MRTFVQASDVNVFYTILAVQNIISHYLCVGYNHITNFYRPQYLSLTLSLSLQPCVCTLACAKLSKLDVWLVSRVPATRSRSHAIRAAANIAHMLSHTTKPEPNG